MGMLSQQLLCVYNVAAHSVTGNVTPHCVDAPPVGFSAKGCTLGLFPCARSVEGWESCVNCKCLPAAGRSLLAPSPILHFEFSCAFSITASTSPLCNEHCACSSSWTYIWFPNIGLFLQFCVFRLQPSEAHASVDVSGA